MLAGCFLTIICNASGFSSLVGIDGVIIGASICLVATIVLSFIFPDEKAAVTVD